MTVSSDYVRDLTRREILRGALRTARLLNARQNPSDTHPLVVDAVEILERRLADLQAEGMLDETGELKTLNLVAGTLPTTDIALPSETNDVRGTCMLITGNGSEQPVFPMSQEEWETQPNKEELGTPNKYYVHRLLAVTLRLHPGVSDDAVGWQLRYRQIRLLKGAGSGSNTMDLRRHWSTYLVYAVAHDLAVANSQDVAFCGYLRSERDRLRTRSLAHSRPKAPITMHLTYRKPW